MWTTIYWIEAPLGRLGVAARPRGGDWLEDELVRWRRSGVGVLCHALEDAELAELELGAEAALGGAVGLRIVRLPIEDRGVPGDARAYWRCCEALAEAARAGEGVLIHCRQGIGRASLLAVGTLVCLGVAVEEAWRRVEVARGREVPDTPAQRAWVSG
jgi:protein-tyrosine phosphatase